MARVCERGLRGDLVRKVRSVQPGSVGTPRQAIAPAAIELRAL
jgi:hypothetical protein